MVKILRHQLVVASVHLLQQGYAAGELPRLWRGLSTNILLSSPMVYVRHILMGILNSDHPFVNFDFGVLTCCISIVEQMPLLGL